MYYPIRTRIAPMTAIRRERILPMRGTVLVQPGELVGSADVVARCDMPGEIQVLNVSRALKLRRERVDKCIRVAPGDMIQAGEILAAPLGLRGRLRNCRASTDGQVIAIRNGLILIEAAPSTLELRAHLKGQVSNVMPELGVVISTSGSLIQGTWGSGGEAEGVLKVLADDPNRPLRTRSIDVSCQGTLIVGGRILDEKPFEQAIEAKVRGIIAGSANADLLPVLEDLPFPVILTEGFGTMPMSAPMFSLMHTNMGRETMINADTQTRWDVKRPEIIIPLRPEDELRLQPDAPMALEVGRQVRAGRAPHFGTIGTVTNLPALPQAVESGARLPVAEVELEGEERVLIPLANLELIG